MLNGYFLNRFDRALPPRASAWLTAVLFAVVHVPNWFLMAVALLGGWCATEVYRRIAICISWASPTPPSDSCSL